MQEITAAVASAYEVWTIEEITAAVNEMTAYMTSLRMEPGARACNAICELLCCSAAQARECNASQQHNQLIGPPPLMEPW